MTATRRALGSTAAPSGCFTYAATSRSKSLRSPLSITSSSASRASSSKSSLLYSTSSWALSFAPAALSSWAISSRRALVFSIQLSCAVCCRESAGSVARFARAYSTSVARNMSRMGDSFAASAPCTSNVLTISTLAAIDAYINADSPTSHLATTLTSTPRAKSIRAISR